MLNINKPQQKMKALKNLRIDYRFSNWGKTERIVCELDKYNPNTFALLKHGQIIGTIFKEDYIWKSSSNSFFLPADIAKIGAYIDKYLKENQHWVSTAI